MEDEIYAFQHFGFTATQVSVERKHLLKSLLDAILKNLIEKATKNANTSNLLKEKKDEIEKNLIKSIETELDELAALDRKYFQIPDNVLLAQDYEHIGNFTAENEKEVDDEIEKLRQSFLENAVMIKALEQQEATFESAKPFIEHHIITREKTKAAINMLNKNKLSNVLNLINATKQVCDKLKNADV